MTTIQALPDPPDDALPEHWTEGAVNTYEAVLAERDDLKAADIAALWTVCTLITTAEVLEESAREALWITGSTGQQVLSPAVAEARQTRAVIATVLNRLVGPSAKAGALTNSQRGSKAARARWGNGR